MLAESLIKISPWTVVETTQTFVLLHVCIHPFPAHSPQHLKDLLH